MDSNPPTTADFAWSDAQAARLTVQDCLVLIGLLAGRVTALEDRLGFINLPDFPELPSKMNGFGSVPRREAAARDALKTMRGE